MMGRGYQTLVCPKLVYPFPFIFAISHIHASDHTHWSYVASRDTAVGSVVMLFVYKLLN